MKKFYLKCLMLVLLPVLIWTPAPCFAAPAIGKPALTAFGEALVGQLYPQYQGSFEYTVSNTDLNINTVEEGGTITQANGMAVLTTTTTTASTAYFRGKPHAKYRAGLGGLSRFTGLFSDPVNGTEQYIGIMDEPGSSESFMNGFAVGYVNAVFGFLRWTDDTLTIVAQADWNIDTMGAGTLNPSGMTLIHTNLNVYQIKYQYLGAGAISLFVEDDRTGEFTLVHRTTYTNANTEPSVHNPNFHHTMWVNNGATVSNIILKSASYAYFIEGRTRFIELHQPINTSGTKTKTTVTTEVAIFTIRNKSAYVSKTNFIDIHLLSITASIEASAANNLGTIRIVKNATLGGTPSFSNINTSNSVVEIDTAGTTVTGGQELGALLLAGKNAEDRLAVADNNIILNPGESITISGSSANSATIKAAMRWRELF